MNQPALILSASYPVSGGLSLCSVASSLEKPLLTILQFTLMHICLRIHNKFSMLSVKSWRKKEFGRQQSEEHATGVK